MYNFPPSFVAIHDNFGWQIQGTPFATWCWKFCCMFTTKDYRSEVKMANIEEVCTKWDFVENFTIFIKEFKNHVVNENWRAFPRYKIPQMSQKLLYI